MPSVYVRRCQGDYCGRRVQGLTSFRVTGKGKRSDECKFCEARAKEDGYSPSKKRHLKALVRDAEKLEQALTKVRNLIASRTHPQSA